MSNIIGNLKTHFRRRLLIGLVVIAPFGLTIFILIKLVTLGKNLLSYPITLLLQQVMDKRYPDLIPFVTDEKTGRFVWWLELSTLAVSIILVLLILYGIGVLSATFFGRRYITLGENILRHVPGAQFIYNTIKQLVDILSRPKSNAFKQVVLVEYPRRGVWSLAFFTGYTRLPDTEKVKINVFLPSTPNPTTGFLLLMNLEDVYLTNLTVSQASRFIFSFGVVEMDGLETQPFPVPPALADVPKKTEKENVKEDKSDGQ